MNAVACADVSFSPSFLYPLLSPFLKDVNNSGSLEQRGMFGFSSLYLTVSSHPVALPRVPAPTRL